MIKALLFDFNGTLDVMQEERILALQDVIEKVRTDISGNRSRELAKEVLVAIERIDVKDPTEPMEDIFSEALEETLSSGELKDKDSKELYQLYRNRREEYRDIEETFVEVADQLADKYRLFILSHAHREDIEKTLKDKGLLQYFEHIYLTRERGLRKPNTEIFPEILEENNLNPEECVMIGDDSLLDLFPAKIVGLHTLLFSRFVDATIDDYTSLEEAVDSFS